MRDLILLIAVATLFSCGQNDTKQKELELKEKELELRQKELNIKESEIKKGDSILSNSHNNPQENLKSIDQTTSNIGENFIGIWQFKDNFGEDAFLKISKTSTSIFNVQKGHKPRNSTSWGNLDYSIGKGVELKLMNGKLIGKYREWGGSAADSYYDVKITLELSPNKTLMYKSEPENFTATKVN
ncbi:MAG: hypothetical protein IPP81_20040 [Chitinophagaceae bacterium]|nr:hypothetical protein [Chitinophagaceae bacterium]